MGCRSGLICDRRTGAFGRSSSTPRQRTILAMTGEPIGRPRRCFRSIPSGRFQGMFARSTSARSRRPGDCHPFNIVFDARGDLVLLDTSRGSEGDPADDVACLAINYLFFALEEEQAWGGLRELWYRFWDVYLSESGDQEVLDVVA